MRIPLPIVLVLVFSIIGGLWWARTKDMDFMTPSGETGSLPEYVTRPYDPDPSANLPKSVARVADAGDTARLSISDPKKSTLEFGDLAAAPGLTEYAEHVPKGAAFLTRLAAMLETQGEFQRVLQAATKERKELLRTLFATDTFQAAERRLAENSKEAKNTLDALDAERKGEIGRAVRDLNQAAQALGVDPVEHTEPGAISLALDALTEGALAKLALETQVVVDDVNAQ